MSVDIVKLRQDVDALTRELREIKPFITAFKTAYQATTEALKQPTQQTPTQQPQQQKTPQTATQIMDKFPPDLREHFTVEQRGNKAVLRLPKKVDYDTFSKIAAIAKRQLGGEYISAGPNTRFEIPL